MLSPLSASPSAAAYHENSTRVQRINLCNKTIQERSSSSNAKARSSNTTLGNYTFNGFRQFSSQHDTRRTQLYPSWPFNSSPNTHGGRRRESSAITNCGRSSVSPIILISSSRRIANYLAHGDEHVLSQGAPSLDSSKHDSVHS